MGYRAKVAGALVAVLRNVEGNSRLTLRVDRELDGIVDATAKFVEGQVSPRTTSQRLVAAIIAGYGVASDLQLHGFTQSVGAMIPEVVEELDDALWEHEDRESRRAAMKRRNPFSRNFAENRDGETLVDMSEWHRSRYLAVRDRELAEYRKTRKRTA